MQPSPPWFLVAGANLSLSRVCIIPDKIHGIFGTIGPFSSPKGHIEQNDLDSECKRDPCMISTGP